MNHPLISGPVIHAIPIQECGEALISLHELPLIRVGHRWAEANPGYHQVREGVAKRLLEAQQHLPDGVFLQLEEGFRPISLQRQLFEDYQQQLKQRYPDWNPTQLHRETTRFIADPEGAPPHSTGGAVDLCLVDAQGQELNMGSGFDEAAHLCEYRSYTDAAHIPGDARKNRKLLVEAMNAAGFVNYFTEWWHWSYGDQYWGYYHGRDACYGAVAMA